jgi:transposase
VIGLGSSALKIYLAVEPCDMRMGFNGLATAATEQLSQTLAPDALVAFINKRRTRVKLLCFDGTGTWLATKRLEKGTFSWPAPGTTGQRKITLAPEALRLLLDGVDMRGARFRPWYERPD